MYVYYTQMTLVAQVVGANKRGARTHFKATQRWRLVGNIPSAEG